MTRERCCGGLHAAYFPDGAPVLNEYVRDLDQARALLAEAGASDLTFTLTYSPTEPGPWSEQLALLLQAQLAEAGITMNLEVIPVAADLTARLKAHETDAHLYGQNPAINSVYYSMLQSNKTGSFTNYHSYSSEEFDGLLTRMEQASAQAELDELRTEAHEFIAMDMPEIALVERLNTTAFSSAVSGINNKGNLSTGDLHLVTVG